MTQTYEQLYIQTLEKLLEQGIKKEDRTGTGTLSLFAEGFKIDISKSFPLLQTKKVSFKNIAHELLWFMGNHYKRPYNKLSRTNIKYLVDNGVNIWNEWPYELYKSSGGELSLKEFKEKIKSNFDFADVHGNLGPVYGHQWCAWGEKRGDKKLFEDDNGHVISGNEYTFGVNQISDLVKGLKQNPFSRRHVLSAWNVSDIKKMALPPCHLLTIFNVVEIEGQKYLNCDFKMRSNDFFLGNPYNIASYTLLTYMLAQVCDMKPLYLNFSATDLHLYLNHVEQAKIQIDRYYAGKFDDNVQLRLRHRKEISEYNINDFEVKNYYPMSAIKAPIAV